MVVAIAPIVILLAGLLMWLLSSNPKVQRMGEILFFCGCFVLTWVLSSKTLHIG